MLKHQRGGAGAGEHEGGTSGEKGKQYMMLVCVFMFNRIDEGNFWLVNETFSVLVSRRVWSFQ